MILLNVLPRLLSSPLKAVTTTMPAVHLLHVAVDVAQVILLLTEVRLAALDHMQHDEQQRAAGRMHRATSVISGLMESIITSTPDKRGDAGDDLRSGSG